GIRDFHVTGVQTCALPIYKERIFSVIKFWQWVYVAFRAQKKILLLKTAGFFSQAVMPTSLINILRRAQFLRGIFCQNDGGNQNKIGRASCRGRNASRKEKR